MNTRIVAWFFVLLALLVAPLLLGIINKTKALFAGRRGAPLLQPYYDVIKLLGKGAVYSQSTTFLFRAGPIISLVSIIIALLLLPLGGKTAALAFTGDLILFAYVLGLVRFFTVTAALDTASSFEGMGASREVFFSAFAEPALFCGLIVLAKSTGALSLSEMLGPALAPVWKVNAAPLVLIVLSLLAILLAENSRIPVDDPNTHLELTMIHEVMVLDHSGPDFAFVQYGAALKLLLSEALLVRILMPVASDNLYVATGVFLAGLAGISILVGVVESVMARLRLLVVSRFLVAATIIAAFAIALVVK
ncbi:NADH-quinone oxidoreductase subunit H [candidate division KSB1 bacterium]|nr:NADH-quinone oxidoreductase subunit H [candidate division KSB1 bacterium]